jgi:uncharacterized protein YbcI
MGEMNTTNVHRQLEQAVREFLLNQMSIRPAHLAVHVHDDSVEASLGGVMSASEKSTLRDRFMAELLCRSYASAYRHVRAVLEAAIAQLLGVRIVNSSFALDPESDCATIRISLTR